MIIKLTMIFLHANILTLLINVDYFLQKLKGIEMKKPMAKMKKMAPMTKTVTKVTKKVVKPAAKSAKAKLTMEKNMVKTVVSGKKKMGK